LRRVALAILMLLVMVSTFASVSNVHASTPILGIITSNAVWTKADSPYVLQGATAVAQGVTLTIEPGVTVSFNDNYIQVNGTLIAIGSSNEKINFNGGRIMFTNVSNSWNQQTGSGSIIENAILGSSIETINASPKIDANIITSPVSLSGSSIVSGNIIKSDLSVYDGSPVISNNVFTNSLISTYSLQTSGYLPVISNNTMTGQGIKCYGGNGVGGYAYIYCNSISGCDTAIFGGASIIERNYIFGNTLGIDTLNGVILNNTISNNVKGINIPRDMVYFFGYGEVPNNPIINYNNFYSNVNYLNTNYSNTNYAVYTTASNNINATYNWWGTTNTQLISQQIYDYRNDFGIGNVTFVPYLTEQNSQAMPDGSMVNIPVPTPNPSAFPTSTPSSSTSSTSPSASSSPNTHEPISTSQAWIAGLEVPILFVVIVVLLIVIMILLLKRRS
jgi:hypothetical protein